VNRLSDSNLPKYDEWLREREPGGRFYNLDTVDDIGGFILASSLWNVYLKLDGNSDKLEIRRNARDAFFEVLLNLLREIDKGTTIREAMKQLVILLSREKTNNYDVLKIFINNFIKMNIFKNGKNQKLFFERPILDRNWLFKGYKPQDEQSIWFEKREGILYLCMAIRSEVKNHIEVALINGHIEYPEGIEHSTIHFLKPIIDVFREGAVEIEIEFLNVDETTLSGATLFIQLYVPYAETESDGAVNEYKIPIP